MNDSVYKRAVRVIDEYLDVPGLSVADIAEACQVTERELRDAFLSNKVALSGYITERRVHRAETLLHTTSLSVLDICFECGFSDTASFNRAFKRKHGVPPSEWRKANVH